MPTVIARLDIAVDTGDLDARVGAQVEQLQKIVALIAGLVDDPPTDVGDFIDLAGNLPLPELAVEGDFATILGNAVASLPVDLGSVTGAVSGDLNQFVTLVTEELEPLLRDAVRMAASIDTLVSMDFRCGIGQRAATGGGSTGAEEGEATPTAGAERLAATATQVQQVNDMLDRLPATPSPGGLLEFLFPIVDEKSRNKFFQIPIPVIDDVIEPLRTLSRWAGLTASDIGLELEATLELLDARLRAAVPARLDDFGVQLAGLNAALELPALTTFADAYGDALTELLAALDAHDAPATAAPVAALNAALDAAAPLLAAWDGGLAASVAGQRARLDSLADELLDEIGHLLMLLEPIELPSLAIAEASAPKPPDPAVVAAVQEAVQPALDWMNALLELLDFTALQTAIGGVSGQAQELADQIEQRLTGVALQVQALFDGLAAQLASLNLGALEGQLEEQIEQFGTSLRHSLGNAFGPAAAGIDASVRTLSDAVEAFDPNDVVAALQSVVQAITGVLEGADVQDAVEQVRSAIAQITETLEQLSFAPITDEVVSLIEQMTQALQQLGGTDLNDAAKAALAVALEVLPDDLKPVTDPLLAEFDSLIESGPVPLLERVAAKPAVLLAAVTRFEPSALVGDSLGAPFRDVLQKAEAFRPGTLIEQADAALASGKLALRQSAGPKQALAALSQPFAELKNSLHRYSPDAVLQPLETALEDIVEQVVAASPIDEIFGAVNRVFDLLDAALGVPRNLLATLQRLNALLAGFADSAGQIDTWRDGLLDKVLDVDNLASIDDALTSLTEAIATSAHDAVLARYDAATADLRAALDAFAPGGRVTALVTAHNRAHTAAAALADSPQKTAALAVLARFDPGRAPPLRGTQELHQSLQQGRGALEALTSDWQALIDAPDSLLGEIAALTADADGLRQLLATAIEPALAPLRYAFAELEAVEPVLTAMQDALQTLVDSLTAGVADLVTGPASLQSISESVQQVVDTFRHIDLSFLRAGLQELFGELEGQIDAVDPAQLAASLDATFAALLDAVGIDQIVPPATVAALDADYVAVLERLRALDPQSLITDVVQPEYDATVVPLVQAFDLTPAFNALIEFLRNLAEELGGELDRVNGAYQSLRAARPSLAGSISVNVSL